MTIIDMEKDLENLTLEFVAEFNAGVERVWEVWEDPRQLERWWGPPEWPATFVRHEFVPGGESRYYMTGPDGEKSRGWWKITAIEAPHRFEFEDGFAGDDGEPSGFLGSTHCVVTLGEVDGVTRMRSVTRFASLEQFEEMLKMGMEDGMRSAVEQIDALLADSSVR